MKVDPVGALSRDERVESLRAAATTLAGGGGRTLKVEEVLPLCGDLLRRSEAVSVDLGGVEQALKALSPAGVSAYLESLESAELAGQLRRAADEAVEAGLAETEEERELWAASALEALFARDRAQSVQVAVRRWTQLQIPTGSEPPRIGQALEALLQRVDREWMGTARSLTALNPRRRLEQALLNPQDQAEAWWFTRRSGCDELLPKLADASFVSAHTEQCPECQRDLERARPVETPPERHLSSDDLWRLELGELSTAQRRKFQVHAEECLECAQLLWAMDEGDKAIAGLEAQEVPFAEAAPSPSQAGLSAGAGARPQRTHREVARREAYRVVAIRGPRMRVLVQPNPGRGLALAVMSLPPQRSVLQPTHSPEGLVFDLGDAKDVEGRTARLTVQVREGGENEVVEVPL